MAVKPEVIKARLKAKYPKANLSTKRLDAIAARLAPKPADDADDDAVDAVLAEANDFMSFEEIAREDDRVRTLEANQKPKPEPNPNPNPNPPADPPSPPTPDDTPSWAKSLMESNAKLEAKITALETGKITESKQLTAQQAFEKSELLKGLKPEIKATWLKRLQVTPETTDEEITSQIESLETEYSELTQNIANNSNFAGPPPAGQTPKVDDKAVESIVESL